MKQKIYQSTYIHCIDLGQSRQQTKRSILWLFNLSIFFALTILMTGCEKVLDQNPLNEVDDELAIADLKGAQAAVAGLYNQLQDQNYYGRNFQIMCDVASDQAQSIGTWDFYREMDTYQISTGNTENGYFYSRAYKTIFVANTILDKVPGLRGLYFFIFFVVFCHEGSKPDGLLCFGVPITSRHKYAAPMGLFNE